VNALDRAIAFVAPGWGLKRARDRANAEILNSYRQHGASRTKKSMAGWRTFSGGPDLDIVENLPLLRERSRDLQMGEGIAAGALKTIRTNEVGPGLQLNATINAKRLKPHARAGAEWEDNVETEFALWAGTKSCDAARRCNFGQLQALARLVQLASGDVFALLPSIPRTGERYDLRVQLIEGDQVCNPQDRVVSNADIFGGVEVGQYGEPLAYWFVDRHPGDAFAPVVGNLRSVSQPKWNRVPAFGSETGRPLVLHLMEPERPGQRRGVPILAPVMESIKQLGRYKLAELQAAVVSGMFTAAITTPAPTMPLSPSIPTDQAGRHRRPQRRAAGERLHHRSRPRREGRGHRPIAPQQQFRWVRQGGVPPDRPGAGHPYELLVLQFEASYSASRGALLEAWKRFNVGRQWLVTDLCQPVYETWLGEAVARGIIQAPGFFADPVIRAAWCGAQWHGPTQGQLNPLDEVNAAEKRVANGFSTRTQETRELTGGDFWANHSLREREEEARRKAGLTVDPTQAQPTTAGQGAAA
jgi:lambda family phage portal protein